MIKRTIEISRQPVHLSVKLDQLHVQPFDADKSQATTIPCEDIGIVAVDNKQTTYSHHALATLTRFGAAVIICGDDHLPAGILLPMTSHTELVKRLNDQTNVGKVLKKQLWKQIVIAKIKAQAANLKCNTPAHGRLMQMTKEVRSGDTTNVEAQAAKRYWRDWIDRPFKRDSDGGDLINAMLNYGYAVLRAAVARALVSGGLQPALGIHHHNRSNAFCLADDLMEPLRPIIDRRVQQLAEGTTDQLDQPAKAHLLTVLTETVRQGEQAGPLMVRLHSYVASLARCYAGECTELDIPVMD